MENQEKYYPARYYIYYQEDYNRENWYEVNLNRVNNYDERKMFIDNVFRTGFSYELPKEEYSANIAYRHIPPHRITRIDYIEPKK
jgi:uncharacterized protein (UPF0248 family)